MALGEIAVNLKVNKQGVDMRKDAGKAKQESVNYLQTGEEKQGCCAPCPACLKKVATLCLSAVWPDWKHQHD